MTRNVHQDQRNAFYLLVLIAVAGLAGGTLLMFTSGPSIESIGLAGGGAAFAYAAFTVRHSTP